MSDLIGLLAEARKARLKLTISSDGVLHVNGQPAAEPIARALLARKADVRAAVRFYTGNSPVLDWRHTTVLDTPQRCTRCGSPCHLLDPADRAPSHKTCAETAIRCPGRRKPAATFAGERRNIGDNGLNHEHPE